jgi:lysyl-tRNA synthetase class 2
MSERESWRPTAKLEAIRARAEVLATIRAFFADRGVLEVETPLLSTATVTDLHLRSLSCELDSGGGKILHLQTSPEYAMKRLLAAGSGPLYQICKAFRGGEAGRRHNPEFTMLEWYRPGWNHHELMNEIDELLAAVLGCRAGERLSYAEAFATHAGVDPHNASDSELRELAHAHGLQGADDLGRDELLDLLLAELVEPKLGRGRPSYVHDFPASKAALARVRPQNPPLAERFELFVEGLELANGYHELTDPTEQRRRFERDLAERRRRGLPEVQIDERLLAALAAGLPDCAGVALGVDRLVMLALGAADISEVIAFPAGRA